MVKLYNYINGDFDVTIYDDGTKIRKFNKDSHIVLHPESIDCKITNWCDAGCQYCLHPDSEVQTINGKVKISNLKEKDLIYTVNEDTNDIEVNFVEIVHNTPYEGNLIKITLESGECLKLTPNHKVFTQQGWVLAENLTLDHIITYF